MKKINFEIMGFYDKINLMILEFKKGSILPFFLKYKEVIICG